MKRIFVLLMTLVMVLALVGCNHWDVATEDGADMQIAADMTEKAKEYTAPLFREYLKKQSVVDYEITQTNYGFITGNPVVFVVGYQYIVDDSEFLYGYKLKLNENQTFTLLEEGESVGEFILR